MYVKRECEVSWAALHCLLHAELKDVLQPEVAIREGLRNFYAAVRLAANHANTGANSFMQEALHVIEEFSSVHPELFSETAAADGSITSVAHLHKLVTRLHEAINTANGAVNVDHIYEYSMLNPMGDPNVTLDHAIQSFAQTSWNELCLSQTSKVLDSYILQQADVLKCRSCHTKIIEISHFFMLNLANIEPNLSIEELYNTEFNKSHRLEIEQSACHHDEFWKRKVLTRLPKYMLVSVPRRIRQYGGWFKDWTAVSVKHSLSFRDWSNNRHSYMLLALTANQGEATPLHANYCAIVKDSTGKWKEISGEGEASIDNIGSVFEDVKFQQCVETFIYRKVAINGKLV